MRRLDWRRAAERCAPSAPGKPVLVLICLCALILAGSSVLFSSRKPAASQPQETVPTKSAAAAAAAASSQPASRWLLFGEPNLSASSSSTSQRYRRLFSTNNTSHNNDSRDHPIQLISNQFNEEEDPLEQPAEGLSGANNRLDNSKHESVYEQDEEEEEEATSVLAAPSERDLSFNENIGDPFELRRPRLRSSLKLPAAARRKRRWLLPQQTQTSDKGSLNRFERRTDSKYLVATG